MSKQVAEAGEHCSLVVLLLGSQRTTAFLGRLIDTLQRHRTLQSPQHGHLQEHIPKPTPYLRPFSTQFCDLPRLTTHCKDVSGWRRKGNFQKSLHCLVRLLYSQQDGRHSHAFLKLFPQFGVTWKIWKVAWGYMTKPMVLADSSLARDFLILCLGVCARMQAHMPKCTIQP